ncbi:hypothetical protein ACFWDQ_10990 [Streptomyces sp. NPDC060053]|uniref:hypothetical protein n=1 Tax=Streptomyces sp. NPDC060053 TaxID=3347047 RepID=UPI00368ECDC4
MTTLRIRRWRFRDQAAACLPSRRVSTARRTASTLSASYKNMARGVVAPVFRCKPSGGTERTSIESTAVSWLPPDEVSERMAEVYAVRLLDALDGNGPHVRSHDGQRVIRAG